MFTFTACVCFFFFGSAIRISRKGWHMLLNFCFHTALTFAVFAGGINRIKYPIICQAVSAFPFSLSPHPSPTLKGFHKTLIVSVYSGVSAQAAECSSCVSFTPWLRGVVTLSLCKSGGTMSADESGAAVMDALSPCLRIVRLCPLSCCLRLAVGVTAHIFCCRV